MKPLLYVYRVLLTGIHLMKTGQVEANLLTLNESARLTFVDDLVQAKQAGEQATIDDGDLHFHEREVSRLLTELESTAAASQLPEAPSAGPALSDLLVRLRLATV